jgi:hypothetical protein
LRIFRRRRLPDAFLEPFTAFEAVLTELEPAKAALAEVMPSTRYPGRPLVDALLAFERGLAAAAPLMAGWRIAPLEDVWVRCEEGVRTAGELAQRLREEAPEILGFEALLGTVESLLDPLTPFEEAADAFRGLRS